MMTLRNKILFFLFTIIVIWRPVTLGWSSLFENNYWLKYESLKKLYYNSQYVRKENPGIIPDHILESFAGGIFLKGLNPILIVHDQPPLGRYLISLSIALFNNTTTIPIFLLAISLVGVYLVAAQTLHNKFIALIPVAIFANEPLFIDKFNYLPLLEPIQLPFIVFSVYFFMKGNTDKRNSLIWLFFSVVMIGFVISIRYFVLGGALLVSFFSYLLFSKSARQRFFAFCLFQPVALLILLLSYFRTFQSGYDLIKVLGIQKYIFTYHQSAFILPFSFWDLLLFNRWHTWWDDRKIVTDPQWIITWPIALIGAAMLAGQAILKKMQLSKAEVVLLLWCVLYSLSLSTGYTSTRYFLPLIPFLYILATSSVIRSIRLWKHI